MSFIETKDLIHEGIATRLPLAASTPLVRDETKDLIHEGIATPKAYFPNLMQRV